MIIGYIIEILSLAYLAAHTVLDVVTQIVLYLPSPLKVVHLRAFVDLVTPQNANAAHLSNVVEHHRPQNTLQTINSKQIISIYLPEYGMEEVILFHLQ